MNLHTNKELFTQAITATAQQMKIPEIYIEKDYWVTLALKTIFQSELTTDAVFKGGTALSKCYHIIERFSEDIDLCVLNLLVNKYKNNIQTLEIAIDRLKSDHGEAYKILISN